MMVDPEYHAFGPWIIEINDKYPLPPLFLPYYKESKDCLLLIKIPRNIDRKDAKPGMDLYDYVIGMYEDHIYLLQRRDKLVEEDRISYADIEGIEDSRELLKGMLTIFLKGGKVVIPYNTVSGNTVSRLIKIIRDRYAQKAFDVAGNGYSAENLNVDILYVNLLREMKSIDEKLQVGAVQPTITPALHKGTFLQRILGIVKGEKLLNTVHLINNRELISICRINLFKKWMESSYGYVVRYLPVERLGSITMKDYEKFSGLKELNLELNERVFKYYFEEDNKKLIDFYSRLKETA